MDNCTSKLRLLGSSIALLSVALLPTTACVSELDDTGEYSAEIEASEVTATITAATCGNSDGAISLVVNGMSPPFTYLWSTMETTDSITDLAAGTYSVTVTDALMDTVDLTYHVGNETVWTNLVNASVGAGNVVTKTNSTGWTSGAVSDQVLTASTDGAVYLDVTPATTGRFVVGLSDNDVNANFTSIDFALFFTGTSMLMFENGVFQGSAGPAAAGDRFHIERVGTALNYYRNGAVVRTTTVAADIALLVDSSLYDTAAALTDVTTSFCAPTLTIDGLVTHTGCSEATGAISVTPSGGVAPYTYSWDHGPTTATITDLPATDYTVTVTDALSRSVQDTYTVLANSAGWARLDGVTFDSGSGTLTKTATTAWGNGGGASSGSIAPNGDGSLQFEILAVNGDRYMVGLSVDDADDHYNTIDYALYYAAGSILIYEDGVYQGGFGPAAVGEVYRVAREGSNIVYYRDDTVLRTVATTPGDPLYVDFSIYYQDAQIHNLATTFCSVPSVNATVSLTPPTCGLGNDGAIDLTVTSGTPPYTFVWAHGPMTEDLTDLFPGDYSVTITDSLAQTFERTYRIGYDVAWSSLTGVSWDAPTATMTKTGPIGWTAGAYSSDTLDVMTDGWVSFDVPAVAPPERYFVGLSDTDGGLAYATIGFAWYFTATRVYIYESGVYTGVRVTPVSGDKFAVSREGTNIVYYHNQDVIRTVAADDMIDMNVDVSMYDAGSVINNLRSSFCTP